jgi:hypothetical protein
LAVHPLSFCARDLVPLVVPPDPNNFVLPLETIAVHGNRFITHLIFQSLPKEILQGQQQFDAEVRKQVMELAKSVYQKVLQILDAHYQDAYFANLFKNAARCQNVKELFS